MAWLWTCLFILSAHSHRQALGETVNCLWERYFLVGGNVTGACHVDLTQLGCGSQSLHLTVAGEPVVVHRYASNSAHFTIPAPANGTLHLHCELTCSGLTPFPYCDITLLGGYPPLPPPRPECLIPHGSTDVHCSWDPGEPLPPLPVNYTLHWEQRSSSGERKVEAGLMGAVIPRLEYSHGTMSVWVVARNPLGWAQSERRVFYTLDIEQPLAPNITHHSFQPLEIFWDLECNPDLHMTADEDRSCEVQYRTRGEQAWTEGDDDAQDSFLLLDTQPFTEYDFRVRCACFGKTAVKSAWSIIYQVQSSESAPVGKLDVWSNCDDSDEKQECEVVWKEPPVSVARGRVLGYLVTVERNPGNLAVMNLSADELGAAKGVEHMGGCWGAPCFRLPISLQGVMGVRLTAYTSQGVTDPAPLALPAPVPQLLKSGHFAVTKEGQSFNVSWDSPPHLTGDVQYVVQLKEAGVHSTQAFNWIKLEGNQRSVIVTGDFRNYTPYNISLFRVFANRRSLLGSVITHTVQGVPQKVTGFKVPQISVSEVTLSWEPLNRRTGVILCYRLGLGNHTEYNVSGDSSSLLISGLQPGQEYRVWICAENKAGQGPKTYLHFMTHSTNGYVMYTVLPVAILALGSILVILSCREYGVHVLKRLRCCAEVPDPVNSRLFRQPQCSCGSWIGIFSVAESVQKLSDLEVVEWKDVEDDWCPERTSLRDGQTHGRVEAGPEQTDGKSAGDEVEQEWTESLGEGGLELSSREDEYRNMIDEEGESWSPAETQDFFSGYEKHFMPSPLEV